MLENTALLRQELCRKIDKLSELNKTNFSVTEKSDYEQLDKEIRAEQKRILALEVNNFEEMQGGIPTDDPLYGQYASIDGKSIRMLTNKEKLSKSFAQSDGQNWNLAEYVRSNMGIKEKRLAPEAIISGPATVPVLLGNEIIDTVRAKCRIIQAGAVTIPISSGSVNLAKITTDPVVYTHVEGTADITESLPVISPILLAPQSLAALIPISFEMASDSQNLDQILRVALANSFSLKLDTLGLAAILADGTIPTSSAGENCATWAGTLAAVTSALAADQEIPNSIISSVEDFGARAAETGGLNGWLNRPEILKNLLDLPTTGMTQGTAIFGNFAGVAVAVRQDLSVELILSLIHI